MNESPEGIWFDPGQGICNQIEDDTRRQLNERFRIYHAVEVQPDGFRFAGDIRRCFRQSHPTADKRGTCVLLVGWPRLAYSRQKHRE